MLLKLRIFIFGTGLMAAGLAGPTMASGFNLFGQSCQSTAQASVCAQDAAQKGASKDPVTKLIKGAAAIVAYITGIAGFIMIIISGIMFVTASGDAAKVARARSTLIYAVVGLVVSVVAWALITFVINRTL